MRNWSRTGRYLRSWMKGRGHIYNVKTYTSSLKQQGNIAEQMAKKSRYNTKTQLLELILHVLLF